MWWFRAEFGAAVMLGLYGGDTSAVATTINWALLLTALRAVLAPGGSPWCSTTALG
jgi:hypothetical protein